MTPPKMAIKYVCPKLEQIDVHQSAAERRPGPHRTMTLHTGDAAQDSDLHQARLDAVLDVLVRSGTETVVDLGCGAGALLSRLVAMPRFRRIAGLDNSAEALSIAERELAAEVATGRLLLLHASFASAHERLAGFDAAVLVETIEHIEPRRLSAVEHAVFGRMRPGTVVITTPNQEYNELYGMPEGTFRHPEHRFEWTRAKFRDWARGLAARNGYRVRFEGIGEQHAALGAPTQMAIFSLPA